MGENRDRRAEVTGYERGWADKQGLTVCRDGSKEVHRFQPGIVSRPGRSDLGCGEERTPGVRQGAHLWSSSAASAIHSVGTNSDLVDADTKIPVVAINVHAAISLSHQTGRSGFPARMGASLTGEGHGHGGDGREQWQGDEERSPPVPIG